MTLSALAHLGVKSKLMSLITTFSQWLIGFGTFGIFTLSLLDSAMVPTAGACDAALVAFTLASPAKWWFFALAAAIGSTIGCFILYSLVQRAGEKLLKSIKSDRRQKIEGLFKRYDMLTLIVAGLLPPPFPFKPFIICAGAVRFDRFRLFIALLIGRGIRYGIVGYLAKTYGNQALDIIKHNSGWVFIGVAVLVLVVWLFQKIKHSKVKVNVPASEPAQP